VVWNIPNDEHKVYLTFDDGPTPGITDKTLGLLKEKGVIATFFCLGNQVDANRALFDRLKAEGHQIGNHAYSHLKGWSTDNDHYLEVVEKGRQTTASNVFRPPYGKIKRAQLKEVQKENTVVMWTVLPGDFDDKVSVEQCIKNAVDNVASGDIIVLHDNATCGNKMLAALPQIIDGLHAKGFVFDTIPD